jgi:RNase P subunit RPR2
MNTICRHCEGLILGKAYRVTSEDEGIIMLDMIVCRLCFIAAKRLGLHAEAIANRANQSFGAQRSSQPTT